METAASIIAFIQVAQEIGKCAWKTKKLWDQAQDLPEEMQSLMLHLNNYKSIFEVMDRQFPNQESFCSLPAFSLVQDNLKASMSQLRLIINNTDHLIAKIDAKKGLKRKLVAFKMVIGKENSERLTKALQESIALLNLSLQAWNMAITIMTPDLIASQLTQTLKTQFENVQWPKKPAIEEEKESEQCYEVEKVENVNHNRLSAISRYAAKLNKIYTPSKLGRFAMAYTTASGAWQAYVQWPSWLSSSVYELQSSPTGCGWMYSYRVYNIVSSDSDIVKRITKGDKAGVLDLFNKRQASPFDKDEKGRSLLYYAAHYKKFDLCQLLLSLGLREALLEKVGEARENPLAATVFNPDRNTPEPDWMKIVGLFHSYMDETDTDMVLRLFDYQRGCDYQDEYIRIFRKRFLPNFFTGPLIHRLEAFRLGSFHCQSSKTLLQLLAQDEKITGFDVNESTRNGFSLMHSAAIAFSIRFADETLPFERGWAMWKLSPFNDSWSHLVEQVASVATLEELSAVETVQPWDIYHVPTWKGTPLLSVIGGALCYLSPDIEFFHWDTALQKCIQEWVSILQQSGVDLVTYGKQEAIVISQDLRSAFDSNAIEASRNVIRDSMPVQSEEVAFPRLGRDDRKRWNHNNWVPIRLLDLEFGPDPGDWRIVWVPEFEWMANEFWQLIEKESIIMPGTWVDG
ncbi:unnamed protein product [Fusarium equiseti]|uniref:Ankyrin repeat protein n=1 Tax=Fusarium equiseti TaxID=61235 RepID=A0A8J2IH42_FUSEQ|nr:unnamed protein product [Fusarium equiseti]